MTVVLDALTALGFAAEAGEIEDKWRMLQNVGGYRSNADYARCFDKTLLNNIAEDAVAAYGAISCVPANRQAGTAKVYTTLNDGWLAFWRDPLRYASWEKAKVGELFV